MRMVEVISPPMTTLASGRCTSLPGEVESAIGTNPRLATSAVMSTGRRRSAAPVRTASSSGCPAARSALRCVTSTTPLSTAMPNRAMKPTLADRLRFSPRAQSMAIPPTSANGTLSSTSSDCGTERKEAKRSR